VALPEARRRVSTYRLIGWPILVVAGVVVAFVFLKHAYLNLAGGILFPGQKLRHAIDGILENSSVLSFFWELTPTGGHQFIYFVLMSVTIWAGVGFAIIRWGEILSGRIRRARHRVEEARWQKSQGGAVPNVGTLSIQLESEDRWYAKPSGILLLGIIVEVIAGLILLWLTSR
jgi:hypothetical protein